MFIGDIRAIRESRTSLEFFESCCNLIIGSPYVTCNNKNLPRVECDVKLDKQPLWNQWLRSNRPSLKDTFYDLLLASAIGGGYYFKRSPDCPVEKWEKDGSGPKALEAWIKELQSQKLLPGMDYSDIPGNNYGYYASIRETMTDIPYQDERVDVIRSFATGGPLYLSYRLLDKLEVNDVGVYSGNFNMGDVQLIARNFPRSFGADPFRAKACFAILMLVSILRSQGHHITADIPVPADYELPRFLQRMGVISVSDRLYKAMQKERLLDPTTEAVLHLRAASVVSFYNMASWFDVPTWELSDFLLSGYKNKSSSCEENNIPNIKVFGL